MNKKEIKKIENPLAFKYCTQSIRKETIIVNENIVKDSDKSLTVCSLCDTNFTLINEPKLLPCGENLCKNCITNVVKNEKKKTWSKLASGSSFMCPLCDQMHQQPVDGFITNKVLLKMAVERQTKLFTQHASNEDRSYEVLDQFEQIANEIYVSLSDLVNLKSIGLQKLEQNMETVRREISRRSRKAVEQIYREESSMLQQLEEYEKNIYRLLDDNQIIGEINEINAHVTQYIGQVEANLKDSIDTFIVYSNTRLVEDATKLKDSMSKLERLIHSYKNSICYVKLADMKLTSNPTEKYHEIIEKRLKGCLGVLRFDRPPAHS